MDSPARDLAKEYAQQFQWRDWNSALNALPALEGQTVLDLGCGGGDVAGELVGRGASVVGVDLNPELVAASREKRLSNAVFHAGDIRDQAFLRQVLSAVGGTVDGIWSSFATAYTPSLAPVLAMWRGLLAPGGWMALIEVDDLFGHRPLSAPTADLLNRYAEDAFAADRYDFRMGRKLSAHTRTAGFEVTGEFDLNDAELAFNGPAADDVLASWDSRLSRIARGGFAPGSRAAAADKFDPVRADFLACLRHADHESDARVCCCIAQIEKSDTL